MTSKTANDGYATCCKCGEVIYSEFTTGHQGHPLGMCVIHPIFTVIECKNCNTKNKMTSSTTYYTREIDNTDKWESIEDVAKRFSDKAVSSKSERDDK